MGLFPEKYKNKTTVRYKYPMSISIGARVGIGFITMVILLITCGAAGIMGVNKVSESLLFVTGDARKTADGGVQVVINIQKELLLTERILKNEVSVSDSRKQMSEYRKASKAQLKAIKESNLIGEKLLKKVDSSIRRFRGARLSILSSHEDLQGQKDNLKRYTQELIENINKSQTRIQDLIFDSLEDDRYIAQMEGIENQLDQIKSHVILTNFSMQDLFTTSELNTRLRQVKDDRDNLAGAVERARQVMSHPDLEKLFSGIGVGYSRLDQQMSQLIVDYMTFRDDRESLNNIVARLMTNLTEMEQQSGAQVESEVASVDELVTTSSTLILVTAAAGVVVALIALGVIIFTVVYPIRNVAQSLQQIGQGEGDLNVALKESGASELVTLAQGFNGFVEKIRNTVTGVTDSISDLSNASERLRSVSNSAAHAIEQQSVETERAAAAVSEMSSSANSVAHHAKEAANAASSADTSAAKGNQEVTRTIETINRQMSELDVASNVVEQLASDSDSIGSVLNVINDIAEQTNLLALNAAIEAARAGDAGRGFAVVADEVRQLASRTQTATTEIKDVVSKLHDAAGKAVTAMQNSHTAAQQSAKQAEQSGQSLIEITNESNTISEMNLQIASAAEQQALVAETINQNVIAISDQAKDTQTASCEIQNATMQLTTLAERLQLLVSDFKH